MGVQLKSMNANAAELPYLLTKRGTHYSTVVITHVWLTTKFQKLYHPRFCVIAVQAPAVSSNKFFKGSFNTFAIF
jgi:hypothetical protein